MRIILFLLCSITILSCSSTKQTLSGTPEEFKDPLFWKYDEKVRANFKIAFDLYLYDMIAWASSDSVSARIQADSTLRSKLGPEWFCYLDQDSIYHAVYGKYHGDHDIFNPVIHYQYDKDALVKTSHQPPDSSLCIQYARAIHTSYPIVEKFIKEERLKLNWYVLRDSLNRIVVWYLPGQLSNDFEVYGGDYSYVFDPEGKQLIDSIWNSNGFKIVKPSTEKRIMLRNDDNEYPTVDNIFCALNILRKYKSRVSMVAILSKNYYSGLAFNKDEGYSWIHSKRK